MTKLPNPPNGNLKRVFVPNLNRFVMLVDRKLMKVGQPIQRLRLDPKVPHPALPFDWSGQLTFSMEGNDLYGDCAMAAAEHADNTFTGNNGTESQFDPS